jgi:hypothetical protein
VQLPPAISRHAHVLSFFDPAVQPASSKPPTPATATATAAAATATAAAAAGKPGPLFQGWLTKQGAIAKNWKRRFFVLTPELVSYCHSPTPADLASPAGTIAVADILGVSMAPAAPGAAEKKREGWPAEVSSSVSLCIATRGRMYRMYAETASAAEAWVAALGKAARRLQDGGQHDDGDINSNSSSDDDDDGDVHKTVVAGVAAGVAAVQLQEPANGISEWTYTEDSEGRVYYVNTRTLETAWELPASAGVAPPFS